MRLLILYLSTESFSSMGSLVFFPAKNGKHTIAYTFLACTSAIKRWRHEKDWSFSVHCLA